MKLEEMKEKMKDRQHQNVMLKEGMVEDTRGLKIYSTAATTKSHELHKVEEKGKDNIG